ncbi:MAG TPA: hypothetical protein VFN26_01225 [Candidatus Acidoferrum sp.]|nr:hypothetical protein [Candidatus Acidoferrum sp.]
MSLRRSLVLEMAFLLAGTPVPARPAVLGVVAHAYRAHLNAGTVSAGATVYSGDNFLTEAEGQLRLQVGTASIDLAGESAVIVRGGVDAAQNTEAELIKGTLIFAALRVAAIEIGADEAHIRAAEAPAIGQVRVIGPKELHIYARRGRLQFSYRGETEMIAEGQSYRVILDPPEDDLKNEPSVNPPGRRPKKFLFLVIGAAAAGIAYEIHEEVESPDRP